MQNEKNTQQDEVNFTEAELRFARSLEDTLNQALGDGDNVTSIWSRLKPEQRVRVAEGYLSKLTPADPPQDGSAIDDAPQSEATPNCVTADQWRAEPTRPAARLSSRF